MKPHSKNNSRPLDIKHTSTIGKLNYLFISCHWQLRIQGVIQQQVKKRHVNLRWFITTYWLILIILIGCIDRVFYHLFIMVITLISFHITGYTSIFPQIYIFYHWSNWRISRKANILLLISNWFWTACLFILTCSFDQNFVFVKLMMQINSREQQFLFTTLLGQTGRGKGWVKI